MSMTLSSKIESILFVSNRPLDTKTLSKILGETEENIKSACLELQAAKRESGVVLLNVNDNAFQLATNSENSELVTKFLNSDLREKLTDATVEVLTIIAYRQPISRSEIEAIRGVNSQYSIRHLLMRGLIEKAPATSEARAMQYQVTTEFLQHLGIQNVKDLPSFEDLVANIKLPETPEAKNVTEEMEKPAEEKPMEEIIVKEMPSETHEEQNLLEEPKHLEQIEPPKQNFNLRPPLPPKISSTNNTTP